MTRTHREATVIVAFFSLLSAPLAVATSSQTDIVKIRIVEGTDPAYEAQLARKLAQAGGERESIAADTMTLRAERRAMADQGFIISDAAMVDVHFLTVHDGNAVPAQSVANQLAFRPAAFELGLNVYGVLPEVGSDGLIHDMTTLIDHPALGAVSIRERSLATEPRTRVSKYIFGPRFDLSINGKPGLLTVYKTSDGARGRTALMLLTKSRLTTISVGHPLAETDRLFQYLMDIASRL